MADPVQATTQAQADFRLMCCECSVTYYAPRRDEPCPACGSSDTVDALPMTWDDDE